MSYVCNLLYTFFRRILLNRSLSCAHYCNCGRLKERKWLNPKSYILYLSYILCQNYSLFGGILPTSVFRVKYSGNQMRILLHYKRRRGQNLVSVELGRFLFVHKILVNCASKEHIIQKVIGPFLRWLLKSLSSIINLCGI